MVRKQESHCAGVSVGGITVGEKLSEEASYRSSKRIEAPVFAVTVYLPDGRHLIHANNRLAGIDIPHIEGEGGVRFVFELFSERSM